MNNIRPVSFDGFLGNKEVVKQAKYIIESSLFQKEQLPHILLNGSPGTGKTTLARILATEMTLEYLNSFKIKNLTNLSLYEIITSISVGDEKVLELLKPNIVEIPGQSIDSNSAIYNMLKQAYNVAKAGNTIFLTDSKLIKMNEDSIEINYTKPAFIFIDEVHGLSGKVQNDFLILLEQFKFFSTMKGLEDEYNIDPFCCIASTTDPGRLSSALLNRFKERLVFDDYSDQDLFDITVSSIKRLDKDVSITDSAALELSKRCKGIIRTLNAYTEQCYKKMDMEFAKGIIKKKQITKKHTDFYFDLFNIDEHGLKLKEDIKLLVRLSEVFPKTMGLRSLAQQIFMDEKLILQEVEPYLIKLGFMERAKSGRSITEKGIVYLKRKGHIKEKVNIFS